MALFVRISISNYNDLKIHVGDCSFIKLPLIQSIEIIGFQSGLINFIIWYIQNAFMVLNG